MVSNFQDYFTFSQNYFTISSDIHQIHQLFWIIDHDFLSKRWFLDKIGDHLVMILKILDPKSQFNGPKTKTWYFSGK